MKDTMKTTRGTQRKKQVNKRKAEPKVEIDIVEVAQQYLASPELVSVDDFATVAGVKKKTLAEALEEAGAEFYRYDMMHKVPCMIDYKGKVYAQM